MKHYVDQSFENWYDIFFQNPADLLLFLFSDNMDPGGIPYLFRDLIADGQIERYIYAQKYLDIVSEPDFDWFRALPHTERINTLDRLENKLASKHRNDIGIDTLLENLKPHCPDSP